MTSKPFHNNQIIRALQSKISPIHIAAGTELLKQGQYIKVIPVVTKGLLKVFTRTDEKEMLLYYIQPGESCIMSFSACMRNTASEVFALAEEDTEALLIPAEQLNKLLAEIPAVNQFFYGLYHSRYNDLIHTIQQLMFEKLDTRLHHYLKQKHEISGNPVLHLTHQLVANELGTSREVVSRLLKKMEKEKKLRLAPGSITVVAL